VLYYRIGRDFVRTSGCFSATHTMSTGKAIHAWTIPITLLLLHLEYSPDINSTSLIMIHLASKNSCIFKNLPTLLLRSMVMSLA